MKTCVLLFAATLVLLLPALQLRAQGTAFASQGRLNNGHCAVLLEFGNQFYGDRSGTLTDPFGHIWNVATRVENVSHEETARRAGQPGGGAEATLSSRGYGLISRK